MTLVERVGVLVIVMTIVKVSYAAVYKVGDSAGWTTLGTIDYRKWAATKNFQIGDTISKFAHSNCMVCLCYYVIVLVLLHCQQMSSNHFVKWKSPSLLIVLHPLPRIQINTILQLCNTKRLISIITFMLLFLNLKIKTKQNRDPLNSRTIESHLLNPQNKLIYLTRESIQVAHTFLEQICLT